jgi:hypothetical protein
MSEEKREITIKITDLNDVNKVLHALESLFKTLIDYYTEKEELKSLSYFILACSIYFGNLLTILGFDETLKGEQK